MPAMPSGPNLDLYSVFTNILGVRDMENMEISRDMGMGDIEAHTDRPRHFWGIGSRLGHPSNHQNRPRTRRNHIMASRTMFHAPMYVHMGEIPPSFDGIAQKQNARGRGGERDGYGMGGGVLMECFLPTRDPHSPSCGHFHTHFQKTHISRNAGMRHLWDEGWAKQWRWWGGEDKTSRPTRM